MTPFASLKVTSPLRLNVEATVNVGMKRARAIAMSSLFAARLSSAAASP